MSRTFQVTQFCTTLAQATTQVLGSDRCIRFPAATGRCCRSQAELRSLPIWWNFSEHGGCLRASFRCTRITGIVFPSVPCLPRCPCARVSRGDEFATTTPSHSPRVGWSLLPPRGCTILEEGWACSTCSSVSTRWTSPLPQRRSKGGWGTHCLLSTSGQPTLPEAVEPHLVPEGPLHIGWVSAGLLRAVEAGLH